VRIVPGGRIWCEYLESMAVRRFWCHLAAGDRLVLCFVSGADGSADGIGDGDGDGIGDAASSGTETSLDGAVSKVDTRKSVSERECL